MKLLVMLMLIDIVVLICSARRINQIENEILLYDNNNADGIKKFLTEIDNLFIDEAMRQD